MLARGIEPRTPSLPRTCSTPELRQHSLSPPGSVRLRRGEEADFMPQRGWLCKSIRLISGPAGAGAAGLVPSGGRAQTRRMGDKQQSGEAGGSVAKSRRPAEERQQRLAAALRTNLHRRKAQSRARAGEDGVAAAAAEERVQDEPTSS